MFNCSPLVSIQCITYNQSKYIQKALDGFVIQQTGFPFVCCIIDDFSNDGEQEMILNYFRVNFDLLEEDVYQFDETDDYKRFFARHLINRNCYFLVINLKYNHYSIKKPKTPYYAEFNHLAKYIALCEGDDYWVDPLKLQKQFDFMEAHPHHSLCFCNNIKLYPDGRQEMLPRYPSDQEVCPIEDLIIKGGGAMSTHTIFYRQDLYVPYLLWAKGCPVGDLPMMLSLAAKGLVGFLSDVVGVHRYQVPGSWTLRMASDRNKVKIVTYSIINMYRQFDKWTDYNYHKVVCKKILDLKYSILKGDITFAIKKLRLIK